MDFLTFQFCDSLQQGLDAMGFATPTPIQCEAIPAILNNSDMIACAQTGTGKTAAFLLPVLHKIAIADVSTTNTLVVVPTRELAIQIDQAAQGFAYFTGASSMAIYGGNDGVAFETEKRALSKGANIIIATPGRLMAHLNLGYVKFDALKHFILDEADRMLDMGFVDDIMKIARYLPKEKQTLMFSATMPPKIRKLAVELLHNPVEISLALSKPAEGITQQAYVLYDRQKDALVTQLLSNGKEQYKSVIIFLSTKLKVKELEKALQKAGLKVKAIHSDLPQSDRELALLDFKSRNLQVLVATDILARGIDIEDISLVLNYDVPGDAEDYIHRIGRTARAASTGEAITLVNEKDQPRMARIEQHLGYEVNKIPLPESIGEGPAYTPLLRKNGGSGRRKFFKRKSGFKPKKP